MWKKTQRAVQHLALIWTIIVMPLTWACSPRAGETVADLPYDYVAVVMNEETTEAGGTLMLGLRFKVIGNLKAEPSIGEEIVLIQYNQGTNCAKRPIPLTLRNYAVGTVVRIKSSDLFAAEKISTTN